MNVTTFRIEEMCCPTEERLIRNRLAGEQGIENLEFNILARTLTVTHSFSETSPIVGAISGIGMRAIPLDRSGKPLSARPEEEAKRSSFPVGAVMTVVSGVCAVAAEILHWSMPEGAAPIMILAAVAILTGGYEIAGKAWASLKTFTLNINFLMAVAVIGAVALGEWTEGAMVVFLFAVAELVEARSLDRARSAISGLMKLTPDSASVLRGLGWEQVPIAEIIPGEVIRIKPGDRLPLDGKVRHGRSSVDQAPITGESIPVDKEPGDAVFAGSINQSGTFDYVVTHAMADSTISRIARLVEKATEGKGNAERFIDRFARYYTPAIVAVAVLVAVVPPLLFGGVWGEWIYRGLVMLVIGCPCALVISTPVTIVSGLAAAARRGILIKGGIYLEQGASLKGIAFDKTGTLTEGRPTVTDVIPMNGLPVPEIVCLAAGVEAGSEHPIASAIIREHRSHHDHEDAVVASFEAVAGRGARAVVNGRTVLVGNHRLAHEAGVCNEAVEEKLNRLEMEGKTAVVVMTENHVEGLIGVADVVRPAAALAVGRLHDLGLRTALLTGDNGVTAAAIGRAVGIGEVYSDLLPEDKISALSTIQGRNGAMGMVGDGINDVPVLAHARIGFVMGKGGTDIALETADVALMDDNLMKLSEFVSLSRRTMRVLKQNIAFAIAVKLVFFLLALAGQATLWMAVFADMGASLIVVFSGLRLLSGSREGSRSSADLNHHP